MAANWLPEGGAENSWGQSQPRAQSLHPLIKFKYDSSVDEVAAGIVLVSQSGNARLVLDIELRGDDSRITFLTRSRNGALRLESALKSKIDLSRIECVIARRTGNPLIRYQEIAKNLTSHQTVLHNIETLLLTGEMGLQLKEEIQKSRRVGNYKEILITVSPASGIITEVGRNIKGTGFQSIALRFSQNTSDGSDYISHATFYQGSESIARTCILSACVIANTIQNACNFLGFK